MVTELDNDKSESYDEGAYTAFKEAIEVEDHKTYIEALWFGVDLVCSLPCLFTHLLPRLTIYRIYLIWSLLTLIQNAIASTFSLCQRHYYLLKFFVFM